MDSCPVSASRKGVSVRMVEFIQRKSARNRGSIPSQPHHLGVNRGTLRYRNQAVPRSMRIHSSLRESHNSFPSPNTSTNSPMSTVIPGIIWALGYWLCMVMVPVLAKVMPLLI